MQKILIDIPEGYEHHNESIISNFDHCIDMDIVNKCQEENVWVDYPAWNFFAHVWFNKTDNKWYAKVWRYHSHVATFIEDSIDDLRIAVSDEYGYE